MYVYVGYIGVVIPRYTRERECVCVCVYVAVSCVREGE
jgi:hypothetical protein